MYFKGIKRSINSIYQETKYVANQSSWEYLEAKVRSHKESFEGTERHRVGFFWESLIESHEETGRKRQISKGRSLINTYVWVMQIQGVHVNIIFT